MVQKESISVLEEFKRKLAKKFSIQKIVLFGSRAKNTFNEESDFDLLVISKDLEGVPWHLRSKNAYFEWQDPRPLELLCFTPAEIRRRLKSPVKGIIAQALEKGITF